MSVITRGAHPKALWPGVKAWWGAKYKEHPVEWTEFLEDLTDDRAYVEEVETTGFGLVPEKAEAGPVSYDTHQQGSTQRYTHVAYGMGFIVSEEEEEDNQYKDKAFQRAEMLAFSGRQTEEIVAANILNRGFNTSYTGADGKALFVSDHTSLVGSQANTGTAADFSEAALETELTAVMQTVNSRGLNISLMAKKLVMPPAYIFEAERVLKSQLRVGTANNDINATKSLGLIPGGACINHYLTDADAWFMITNAPHGLKRYTRVKPDLVKDSDFDTGNKKHKMRMRFSVGWTDWRGARGNPGA